MPNLDRMEIGDQTYMLIDRQLKEAIIKGEISAPITLAENSDEALTTENNTVIEATVFLLTNQRMLTEVSRIVSDVVQTLRT